MSDEVNKDWSHWIREDDEPATIARMGARIAKQEPVRFGGVTKVDKSPSTQDPQQMKDPNGTGRGFDKGNRPNDHRPSSVDFPKQGGPKNPVDRNHHLTKMWNDSIQSMTDRARKLQRPQGNK